MPQYKKILAVKFRSLGDTVLMTAPLMELRNAYPQAQIHIAVNHPWAALFENHPAVDQLWKLEPHRDKVSRAKAMARLGLKLRREHFDCVVNFHASPSSSALAYSTGAKTRSIHFHGHKDKNRFSTIVVPGKGIVKPIIERDMDAVRALGIQVPEGRMPFLEAPSQDEDQMWKVPEPVLGMGLGASRPSKSWPLERYAEIADRWVKTTGGGVVAFVSTDERGIGQKFLDLTGEKAQILVEAGLPILDLAKRLSRLKLFLGNDSGPRHVAVALSTPTVTVFGPEDPFEWHPYPQDLHPYLFVKELACRKDAAPEMPPWCGLHICVEERHKCMQEITVNQVWDACKRVI